MFCNTSISLFFSLGIVCYQGIYETATGADLGLAIISPGGVCLGGGGSNIKHMEQVLKKWMIKKYIHVYTIYYWTLYVYWSSLQ